MNRLLEDTALMQSHIGVFDLRNLRRLDRMIVFLGLLLVVVGLLTLYSADYNSSGFPLYAKQGLFLVAGAMLAGAIACFDYRFLVSMAPGLYVLAIVVLLLVLQVGLDVRGSRSWIPIGPFRYQPSEFAKVALVFMLAWYLSRIGRRIRKVFYFVLAFAIGALPAVLILKQNDMGTTLVFPPIVLAMVYAAGCRRLHLAALIILGLIAAPVVWSQLKPHHKERVVAFINPESDPTGQGWQPIQTKIAVGSGRLTGKGYLQGTQTHLRWLPEHHTDFIFSLLAEEMGFAGAVSLLAVAAAFLVRGLEFARRCPDLSGSLLCVGVVTLLAFHMFVNIAVTLALLPVMGIPLPFLSYGGSFYLTTMMCVGILLSVPMRKGTFTT